MPWKTTRPAPSTRGYGKDHAAAKKRHAAVLRAEGAGRCCLGGEAIYPAQLELPNAHPRKVVLDHCACRTGCASCGWTGYRGLACWQHNASDGARRGRDRLNASRLVW